MAASAPPGATELLLADEAYIRTALAIAAIARRIDGEYQADAKI